MALIARHFGASAFRTVQAHILAQVQGSKPVHVAADDIVDAFAAVWTVGRIARGEACTLPASPPRDAPGRRTEIVC